MQSRVVVGCLVVCLFAAIQIQAQKATCTNWKTFVTFSNPIFWCLLSSSNVANFSFTIAVIDIKVCFIKCYCKFAPVTCTVIEPFFICTVGEFRDVISGTV